jgi:hypothetical protein
LVWEVWGPAIIKGFTFLRGHGDDDLWIYCNMDLETQITCPSCGWSLGHSFYEDTDGVREVYVFQAIDAARDYAMQHSRPEGES